MTAAPGTIASPADSLAHRGRALAAVRFGKDGAEQLSYGELAATVAKLARGLSARGMGRDDHVVVLADPSPAWIGAALGIMRATKEGDATLIIGVPRLYRAVFDAIGERDSAGCGRRRRAGTEPGSGRRSPRCCRGHRRARCSASPPGPR